MQCLNFSFKNESSLIYKKFFVLLKDEESEESFLLTSHKVPSDVPESSHDSDLDSEAPATVMALRSESQYVPVPETMLSPDFRPVSASPQCSLFDVGIGSDAQIMTSSLEIRPKWQQRSAIPRAAYSAPPSYSPRHLSDGRSNRCVRNSVTDSPLLKRPTQLQRVQKASRPVSLSPSCRRRSPSRIKKTNKSHEDGSSSSNDDSTDSDVSISKLALVKEAAQSKLDAIARKNLRTTEENQSNYSEKNQISEGKCLLELKADLDDAKSAKILTEQKKTTYSSTDIRRAATIIQSFWRGYRTRNYDQVSVEVRHEIRVRRAEDHVRVLRDQLAKTQIELDRERQLRTLQMEAIRALWNEVSKIVDLPSLTIDFPKDVAEK